MASHVGFSTVFTSFVQTGTSQIECMCIATGIWYNARVSKSPCEYRNGAVTFYFAELERARDQKELPYSER